MNKIFYSFIIIFLFNSCSKSGGSSPPEPKIQFSIDASNASVSIGNTFPVVVTLTSAMPSSKGIMIETIVTDQNTNGLLTQNPVTISTASSNTIHIINLIQQHWSNVTIKVSSVDSSAANNSSKNFTVVYK